MQDKQDAIMQDPRLVLEDREPTGEFGVESLAQSHRIPSAASTDEWNQQKKKIDEYQAQHLLAQKFKEEVTEPELIKHYKACYDYHTMQAQQYRQMLEDVAASMTAGLGKPKVTYTTKMAKTMKVVLKRKQEELLVIQKNHEEI